MNAGEKDGIDEIGGNQTLKKDEVVNGQRDKERERDL